MIDKTSLLSGAVSASNPFLKNSGAAKPSSGSHFSDLLVDMLGKASEAQQNSAIVSKSVQMNNPTSSIEESVIASSKASLGFQMAVQVRNKVVQAYTDIMNMPV